MKGKKITEPVLKLRNFLQRFKRRFSSSSGEGGRGGCCVMIKLTWSPSKTLSLMTSPLNSPPPLFHWQLICSQFFTFPLLNYVADNWSPQVMGSRPPLNYPWSHVISPNFSPLSNHVVNNDLSLMLNALSKYSTISFTYATQFSESTTFRFFLHLLQVFAIFIR